MREVMIGNFAIARGLTEPDLNLLQLSRNAPSSEILPGIVEFKKREKLSIHTEWSTNRRCAFEVAFGGASAGRKGSLYDETGWLECCLPPLLHGHAKTLKAYRDCFL